MAASARFTSFAITQGRKWNEANTAYPLYTRSSDAGFREACDALLANKLMIEQWRDEDRDAELALPGRCSSLSFFHRADGEIVGVCKRNRGRGTLRLNILCTYQNRQYNHDAANDPPQNARHSLATSWRKNADLSSVA